MLDAPTATIAGATEASEEEEDGCLFLNAYVPACLKGEGGGRGGDERGK